jgi:acetate kinase
VFDTAFHQTMDPAHHLYAIPTSYHEHQGIRKYGFHGISHSYIAKTVATVLKKKNAKVISCHLGAGCSVCAIRAGKSVDTSMGLSPLQGLVMGTRSGDVDAELVLYLEKHAGMDPDQVGELLNKESGLKGLCGDSDMLTVLSRVKKKDKPAVLALDIFINRLIFYIGGYIAELNGADAIIFTAGIGEGSSLIRARVCENLSYLGIALDPKKNTKATGSSIETISKPSSKIKILVIPTHEDLMIAQEVMKIAK